MQTYTHYKDSGIDWIGQIPEHWEVSKVKNYLEIPITDGPHTTPILLDEGIPFISAESIKNGKIDFSKKRGNISEEDYKLFSQKYVPQRNDIYMIKSGATTGNIAMVETDDIFTIWSPLAVFRTGKKILPRLLYNVLSSGYFRRGVELNWSFGTQQNIGMGILSNLFITIPPIQEQEAIANFLDRKTAKIDALVQTKEQQIEKLKELRQAKIHQAVTKGLDAHVPTKDSRVPWIGEIPEHWEVKKLKYIFDKIQTGTTPSTLNEKYFNGEIPWYNPKDLNNEILVDSEKKISDLAISDGSAKIFDNDSILIVGIGATAGKTSYLKKRGSFNQQITGFHSKIFFNKYYFYHLKSIGNVMLSLAQFTTLPILNNEFFKKLYLPIPPIQEQEQIVAYLDEVTGKIDQAIAQKQEQITKLKEYKQSLINDVVTGKVKVC